jgi:hypothetical protein
LGTRHRKIDTDSIRHKTPKEDTNPIKKINTGSIRHKTQKEDTNPIKKDIHG